MVAFGFSIALNSEQNFESSASLRSAMWFGLVSISVVKFRAKLRELCLASLGPVVYSGFNLPLNSEQNIESNASLRSAMCYVFSVLIYCYMQDFFSCEEKMLLTNEERFQNVK